MDNCPVRCNTMGQLYPDCMSERKSRFWQIDNQPNSRSEVICPQPRRATRVPCFINTLNIVSSKPKGILPMYKVDSASEILDLNPSQDDTDNDLDSSGQMGFFCGSPPVRTDNPVIHDVQFAKQAQFLASSRGSSPGTTKPAVRVERGNSPTCGSSFKGNPKVRIEGFACGNSKQHRGAPALA
ncbi:hypothetical protein MUK42_00363 [Musa troglodytarum]|uniref:Uncharacterized protein n=1 Tax=Musa troglodytarum TaxID=320322 RepID=A0A9E7FDT4_9LILI|nr:hypothetical protein MUK42_00363 [Musa troglodytarum]